MKYNINKKAILEEMSLGKGLAGLGMLGGAGLIASGLYDTHDYNSHVADLNQTTDDIQSHLNSLDAKTKELEQTLLRLKDSDDPEDIKKYNSLVPEYKKAVQQYNDYVAQNNNHLDELNSFRDRHGNDFEKGQLKQRLGGALGLGSTIGYAVASHKENKK